MVISRLSLVEGINYLSFQIVFNGMPVWPAILNISIGEVTTHWHAPAVAPAMIWLPIEIFPFESVNRERILSLTTSLIAFWWVIFVLIFEWNEPAAFSFLTLKISEESLV